MIDESAIERELELAERIKGRENRHRWLLAMLAGRIVGRRIEGLTKEFGRRCGVKEDSVEQWAKAWRMYRVILHISEVYAAKMYRRELSVSHFYTLWMAGHKYRMTMKDIISFLDDFVLYGRCGYRWSVDVLRQELEAEYSDGKTVNWKRWHWPRLSKMAETIASFDGELNEYPEVKRAVRVIVEWKDKVK